MGKVFIIDMGEGPVTGISKSPQRGEKVVDLTRPADWMWPRDRSVENERRQRQCGQRRPREGHETGLQRERGTIAEIVGLEGTAKLGEGSPGVEGA